LISADPPLDFAARNVRRQPAPIGLTDIPSSPVPKGRTFIFQNSAFYPPATNVKLSPALVSDGFPPGVPSDTVLAIPDFLSRASLLVERSVGSAV
jgi:hypothetical protein